MRRIEEKEKNIAEGGAIGPQGIFGLPIDGLHEIIQALIINNQQSAIRFQYKKMSGLLHWVFNSESIFLTRLQAF